LFFGSMIAMFLIGAVIITTKVSDWLIADVLYLSLPHIYSSNGAYGMSIGRNSTVGDLLMETVVYAMVLVIIQCFVFLLVYVCRSVKAKRR